MARRPRSTNATALRYNVGSAYELGYYGATAPAEVLADDTLRRCYQVGRERRMCEEHTGCSPAEHALDPTNVDRETTYIITGDFPEFSIRADDFLVARPGAETPYVCRAITPALAFQLREHLRVCFEDEADPAPDTRTPAPIRHLTLLR